jgi:hypothetical protein
MPPTSRAKTPATQVSSDDIQWIKDTMLNMNNTLTQLNQTIVGNEAYGQKGLVKIVEEHNKFIEEHKSFKSKLIGGAIVVSALWSIIMNKLFN